MSRLEEAVKSYRQALAKGGDAEAIQYTLASLGAAIVPASAPQKFVSELFDQCAGSFEERLAGKLKYRAPDLLFDVVKRCVPLSSLDILDLGCGTRLLGARLRPLARTLTGVDLSSSMLKIARQRQIYDNLICSELVEFLQSQSKSVDLAVATDVFIYIGDLSRVFHAARCALRDGGFFGFSVEASEEQDFVLRDTCRYAHSFAYVQRLAQDHRFALETIEPKVIREQDGRDVVGYLAMLRARSICRSWRQCRRSRDRQAPRGHQECTGRASGYRPTCRTRLSCPWLRYGILPIGDTGIIISANEDTNSAMLFDGKSGKELATIKVGNHPDSVTFDPKSGLAVVINQDGGDATLVDVKAQKVVGTIPIGGQRLEFSVTDGNGFVYVNIDGVDKVEDKSEIAVLDVAGRKVARRIALPGCARPSGLAYDAKDGLLITSCRNNVAKIVEAKTGLEIASVPIGPGPDCVMFDPARGLALLPTGGDGVLTIVPIRGAKASDIGPATTVPTQVLARLGALDPKTGRLYLPTAQAKPIPDPGERRTLIPGTFAILVLAPS